MMCREYGYQLIGKVHSRLGIAVGQVSDKINQVTERYDASIGSSRGCLHEELSLRLILPILRLEVKLVGARPYQSHEPI